MNGYHNTEKTSVTLYSLNNVEVVRGKVGGGGTVGTLQPLFVFGGQSDVVSASCALFV